MSRNGNFCGCFCKAQHSPCSPLCPLFFSNVVKEELHAPLSLSFLRGRRQASMQALRGIAPVVRLPCRVSKPTGQQIWIDYS